MAIEGLRAVTVWVGDVDAAVDFYVEKLGLEKLPTGATGRRAAG
jgi:Glyoxalase/Bleomycin resistance protein/Dioxygenase superfamily